MDSVSYKNSWKSEEKIKNVVGKHLNMINQKYSTNLQLARFTDLRPIEELKVLIEVGYDKSSGDNKSMVYFINGQQQPQDQKNFDRFIYLFIRTLDKIIEKNQYTLVYFVGSESSGFSRFRDFMKELPVKYYVHMKQMYVFHASLLVRSILWFENSKRGKLWKKMTKFVGTLVELFDEDCFHKRWIEYVPNEFTNGQNVENLQNMRSESIALSSNIINRNTQQSIFNRELSSYDMNGKGIPDIIDRLISYFTQYPERFKQQGIFRKCGSNQELMQLAQCLSEGNYSALNVTNDVNIVADIIKKLFRCITTPLIDYDIYNIIITETPRVQQDQKIHFVKSIFDQIAPLNCRVLYVMLSFLLNLASYDQYNNMNTYNLAVVFAPCFMWPKNQSENYIFEVGITIKFLSMMLENYTSIFPQMTFKLFLDPSHHQSNVSTNSTGSSSGNNSSSNPGSEEERKEIIIPQNPKKKFSKEDEDDEFDVEELVDCMYLDENNKKKQPQTLKQLINRQTLKPKTSQQQQQQQFQQYDQEERYMTFDQNVNDADLEFTINSIVKQFKDF